MGEVLFEITDENLETGMRGYPVGYCMTSSADPQKGLSYVGKPITELAKWKPEEVIYLLLHKKKPSEGEARTFATDLKKRSSLSKEVVEAIRTLPRKGHPMKLLEVALLLCAMIEGENDYHEDCLNLIAKMPELVAQVISHHAGWKVNPSDPARSYMGNFSQMLNIPGVKSSDIEDIFTLFNILHYDHGGGNLSTFIGKGVASGLEDMYGSMAAAMCALEGPRHGRANQDCLDFVKDIVDQAGPDASVDEVQALIRKRLDNKQLVFGFGHAVLRVEDPRASIFYQVANERYPNHPLVKMATKLRQAVPEVLKENPKISNPYPNVDAISGTLLSAAGFSYPEYYTVLFALSRVVGISIQIVYERLIAREGKGLPIIRPKYFYRQPV